MGEAGFDREQFLYVLKWWEIRAILDGYGKRERNFLLMTRWATFNIMCTGMADMKKAGIRSPEDLLLFSWEKAEKMKDLPTEEEFAEMRRILSQGKKGGQQ